MPPADFRENPFELLIKLLGQEFREQAKRNLIYRLRYKALELGLNFDHPPTQKKLLDFATYYQEFVALVKADNDTRSFKEIEGQCTPCGSTQTR